MPAQKPATDALLAAGAALERQATQAADEMRAALLSAGDTAKARSKLSAAQAAMQQHQRQLAALQAEAAQQQHHVLADRGEELARAAADRLRLRLAELAPPRLPAALRGRA